MSNTVHLDSFMSIFG